MMRKAIIYKEWIKTRWVLLTLLILSCTFTLYGLLSVERFITLRGPVHLAQILLSRDILFIEMIRYIPLVCGICLALAQYVPEVMQKRLKLTLHLPLSVRKITITMLGYGVILLVAIFLLQYVTLNAFFHHYLPRELVSHIMNTALVWFISGIAAYGLICMVCIEPTWRVRVASLLLSAGLLRLYFIAPTPQAYDGVLIPLALFSIVIVGFSFISIDRFKSGVQ